MNNEEWKRWEELEKKYGKIFHHMRGIFCEDSAECTAELMLMTSELMNRFQRVYDAGP